MTSYEETIGFTILIIVLFTGIVIGMYISCQIEKNINNKIK